MYSEESLVLKMLKNVQITCATSSLAQTKLSLANVYIEICFGYKTYWKKLGPKLTKMVLPLCFQLFFSAKISCNHFYPTK